MTHCLRCWLLLFLVTLAPPTVWAQEDQQTLNRQAQEAYLRTDAELNRVWKEIQPNLNPVVKKELVAAQQQWINFRDAEARAKASRFEGGSLAPMVYSEALQALTEHRIAELRIWLEATSD